MADLTGATRGRVLIATRVFTLSTALGLAAGTAKVPEMAAAFLALCVVAAVVSTPAPAPALQAAAPVAEATVVALILVSLGSAGTPLTVYLVVPCFAAGLQVGKKWVLVTVAAEVVSAFGALVASHQLGLAGRLAEQVAAWMLVGLGLGLLGSWMRAHGSQDGADQAGYESAHRLLGQLRAVSRRLSTGLDTSALADQMLQRTLEALTAHRAVVLVMGESSGLRVLTGKGEPFREDLEHDPAVEECWRSEQPHQRALQRDGTPGQYRIVLPLRVGARLIGVVVADTSARADRRTLSRLRAYLSEHGLRLEAALLFDDVRSTATLEERGRLAREIHDGVAQEIASLGYLVDDLADSAPHAEAQFAARELRREFTRVVSELRLSIFDLRSNISPHAGLGLALSDYAREIGRRAGMTVHLALSEQPHRLHINVETELLRIAQEAITNARKHAKANNLWVTLNTESPIMMLRVEDDGIGSVRPRPDHYGLRMMQERAERICGELLITPRPRGGTSVVVNVWPRTTPLTGAHHDHLSSPR